MHYPKCATFVSAPAFALPVSPLLPLPIDGLLPSLVESLQKVPRLVLEAPPGAGKTTRVPRALLEAGKDGRLPAHGEIVVLEPRRLAARMAAKRVADELGEPLGETVGYRVRFDDVGSARTRVRFVTEGVLTRRLLSEPTLPGVSAVLLDEFHERHLQGDLALALLTHLQRTTRPDLLLVVMSATLDAGPLALHLDAPTVRSEGKRFPVDIEHLPATDDRPLASQVSSAVRRILLESGGPEGTGDVLVFLPGAGEIRRAMEACERLVQGEVAVVALHGDLSPADQDRAVRRLDRRKVILSTNVAESSVTIDGVTAVVDAGLARVAAYTPWSGVSTLRVAKVSRASAAQRAGRAGRTSAGRCLRLYTKADHDTRPEHDVAEVRRADLAATVLELAASGFSEAAALPWLEPPPDGAWVAARRLLLRLGALAENGEVTDVGRRMLRFPVHPRQARILVEAEARAVADEGALVAALLEERDLRSSSFARDVAEGTGPRRGSPAAGGSRGSRQGQATDRSDLLTLVSVFREAEGSRFDSGTLRALGLDGGAVRNVARAYAQLRKGTREVPLDKAPRLGSPDGKGDHDEDHLLVAILSGYPDRVARRVRGRSLAMGGGGSAELSEDSAVRDAPFVVALDADERRGAVVVVRASGIEPEWLLDLFPDHIEERDDVTWNESTGRVEATSRMLYDGLVLHESPGRGDEEAIARVLAEAALSRGAARLAPEGALRRWLARARFAAEHGGGFTAPTEADVHEAVVSLCVGRRSLAELESASLLDALKARLGHREANRIEVLSPDRISLPGGRSVQVGYEPDRPPWVESYLQDFFSTSETPRIAEGRVPVVVHLLAPNRRAVQVTTDLAGFWARHYQAVRKELVRKYPRHHWPEDPLNAPPIVRTPRR